MSIIISVYWLPIIVGAGLAFALDMVWYGIIHLYLAQNGWQNSHIENFPMPIRQV